MFQFLFKYPAGVFAKGSFVLLGAWPRWMLWAGMAAAAVVFAALLWRERARRVRSISVARAAVLWGLQSALAA